MEGKTDMKVDLKNFTDEMRDSINETIMKSEDKKTEDE